MSLRCAATPFKQRVYDLTSRIPRGCVATYASIGKALKGGSFQALPVLLEMQFARLVPPVLTEDAILEGKSR